MPKITPQNYKILVKLFGMDGWEYIGTSGDHIQLKKAGFIRRIVIPKKKDIPVFIILNNLRTAKISRDRYFELLKEV
ncbi:MAG: type II toxin-antitoxin system HicA family toxin [Patescibacteria group bacterium]|nr:type II toxin-antitoxin system HicA family toxin [Patescibacteria group bacterium]